MKHRILNKFEFHFHSLGAYCSTAELGSNRWNSYQFSALFRIGFRSHPILGIFFKRPLSLKVSFGLFALFIVTITVCFFCYLITPTQTLLSPSLFSHVPRWNGACAFACPSLDVTHILSLCRIIFTRPSLTFLVIITMTVPTQLCRLLPGPRLIHPPFPSFSSHHPQLVIPIIIIITMIITIITTATFIYSEWSKISADTYTPSLSDRFHCDLFSDLSSSNCFVFCRDCQSRQQIQFTFLHWKWSEQPVSLSLSPFSPDFGAFGVASRSDERTLSTLIVQLDSANLNT